MAISGVTDYTNRYVTNSYKNQESEKVSEAAKGSESSSTADYLSKLQKQVSYMTLEMGNALSTARDNKVNTLAINPKLLEKMQNDPEKAKEYTQRLKDIESAQKFVDGYMKAKGSTTKFSHWYVDENGNYSHIAYYEHDNTFYKKLSEKSRENIEKHIEKTKEKVAEKKKELQEELEEKRIAKEDEKATHSKAENLLDEKIGASKDGVICLYNTDVQTIVDAVENDNANKADLKAEKVGTNLDLQI